MKKIIIALLVFGFVSAAASLWKMHRIKLERSNPPPGFVLQCNQITGHWGWSYEGHSLIFDRTYNSEKPFTKREQALERAWNQYDYHERQRKAKKVAAEYPIVGQTPGWSQCEP